MDSVFPDWFTTHRCADIPGGVLIIYPFKCEIRRKERDKKIIEFVRPYYKHIIDLTHFEKDGLALEGKGPLIFDTRNKKIYCSLYLY